MLSHHLREAVLINQVHVVEAMTLSTEGRLVGEAVGQEISPFCPRAITKDACSQIIFSMFSGCVGGPESAVASW